MDNPKKDFFENFDWKSFEQFFGGKLPIIPNDDMNDLSWVENYVQDALKQAFPQKNDIHIFQHHYRTEVFETHHHVVVKIHIPNKALAKKVRTYIGLAQVKLEGLPDDKSQIIKLNSHVIPESCKAIYKKGVLQLNLRKQIMDHPLREVRVRFQD